MSGHNDRSSRSQFTTPTISLFLLTNFLYISTFHLYIIDSPNPFLTFVTTDDANHPPFDKASAAWFSNTKNISISHSFTMRHLVSSMTRFRRTISEHPLFGIEGVSRHFSLRRRHEGQCKTCITGRARILFSDFQHCAFVFRQIQTWKRLDRHDGHGHDFSCIAIPHICLSASV